MNSIDITNVDDHAVRRYGEVFDPGQTISIPAEVVVAYSAMEISQGIQYLSRRAGRIARGVEEERHMRVAERTSSYPQRVEVMRSPGFWPESAPWPISLWEHLKKRRAARKFAREFAASAARRQSHV